MTVLGVGMLIALGSEVVVALEGLVILTVISVTERGGVVLGLLATPHTGESLILGLLDGSLDFLDGLLLLLGDEDAGLILAGIVFVEGVGGLHMAVGKADGTDYDLGVLDSFEKFHGTLILECL